jgi:hypothetical protein
MGETLMRKLAHIASLAVFALGLATAAQAVENPVDCPAVVALECKWHHGAYTVTAVNKANDPPDSRPTDVVPGISCAEAIDALLEGTINTAWQYLTEPVTTAFGQHTHVFFCADGAGGS